MKITKEFITIVVDVFCLILFQVNIHANHFHFHVRVNYLAFGGLIRFRNVLPADYSQSQ